MPFAILILFTYLILIQGVYAQDNPATPLDGKDLFIENRCVNCHTIGRGRFVGPDLEGVGSRYGRQEIEQWMVNPQMIYQSKGKMPVNEGYPPMPPIGVPPEDAKLIADYLLSVKITDVSKPEGGVIKGRVMNETNEDVPEEMELTLTSYLGDRAMEERKSKTDNKGRFEFANLPWDRSYTISLDYKGADYTTDKIVFYPEEDTRTLDLPVYEPTESNQHISVNADHMIIQVSNGQISVAEIVVFHNGSKQVFVGKENKDGVRETLRFDLPGGAENIQFMDGLAPESVIRAEGGFVDTTSFSPGIRRVIYAYQLPFKSGKNMIEKRIIYPTGGFVLLVSDSGVDIKVDGLGGNEKVSINNVRFIRWTGSGLEPGSEIKIELGQSVLSEDSLKWAAFGVVLLLVGIGILYSFRSKRNPALPKDATLNEEGLSREREKLILEIAELDDRFEAGEIAEGEYRDIRSGKKKRLMSITEKIKKSGV
jgi:cytochrome c551/c552